MKYDITIIGGGIAGAGVAQAASAAGYKVLLLEQGEIAEQTSSCSSKLIHGGLRYLETGQLNLVFKALRERRALLRLAPDLVKPVAFYIPVYKNSRRGKWTLRAGLSLYAMLCILDPLSRFKQLPKSEWHKLEHLKHDNLQAVFQYWDAQTDDAQLTRAVVNNAQQLGATIVTQAAFIDGTKTANGYAINYQLNNQFENQSNTNTVKVTTAFIVNAAGPWVNQVLKQITPSIPGFDIDWVQGTHIILDTPAMTHVYYLESLIDDRVVFVMPWQGQTLVGTTETLLANLPDEITPKQQEIDYLLTIYQHYFPQRPVKVVDAFAGVRVLPKQQQQAFDRKRQSIIYQGMTSPEVISLYGGKLTTFRATSKTVVALIEKTLGKRKKIADVNTLTLD
ncbi:Glycerol-3-phosphate dehydrogenase [Thalassotalea sp. ND16A]|nr:Glycerol-3-phosphate dehydrogenase [Thalassotalea sp. ND16A]